MLCVGVRWEGVVTWDPGRRHMSPKPSVQRDPTGQVMLMAMSHSNEENQRRSFRIQNLVWVNPFSEHVVPCYLSKPQFEQQSLVFLYEFCFGSCLMVYIFCFCLDFSWWWSVTWEVLAKIYPFFPNCFWICFLITTIETLTMTIILLYFYQ